MVGELLSGANRGAKGVAPAGAVGFEGVAWETGEGVTAGTSRVGIELNRAIVRALADRDVSADTGAFVRSKGLRTKILRGGFRLLEAGLQLSLAVVDAGSGQAISKVHRILSTSLLGNATSSDVLPPDSKNLTLLARLVQETVLAKPSDFGLRVTTSRGAQAAFAVGDPVRVQVESDRDCYVRLYHVTWSEQTLTLIFPNRGDMDSHVAAGSLKQVPAEGSGVIFEAAEPCGVDAIIAIASEKPFEDDALIGAELTGAAGSGDRGESKGLTRTGDYVAARGVSVQRAKGILARGLLVRLPAGQGQPADGGDAPPVDSAPPSGEQGDKPSGDSAPPPGDQLDRVMLARSACFFTTLPRIQGKP